MLRPAAQAGMCQALQHNPSPSSTSILQGRCRGGAGACSTSVRAVLGLGRHAGHLGGQLVRGAEDQRALHEATHLRGTGGGAG